MFDSSNHNESIRRKTMQMKPELIWRDRDSERERERKKWQRKKPQQSIKLMCAIHRNVRCFIAFGEMQIKLNVATESVPWNSGRHVLTSHILSVDCVVECVQKCKWLNLLSLHSTGVLYTDRVYLMPVVTLPIFSLFATLNYHLFHRVTYRTEQQTDKCFAKQHTKLYLILLCNYKMATAQFRIISAFTKPLISW